MDKGPHDGRVVDGTPLAFRYFTMIRPPPPDEPLVRHHHNTHLRNRPTTKLSIHRNMSITKNNNAIPLDIRQLISQRYKRITKAVNQAFWESDSDTKHSLYVGSYGRGTAVSTSDLDILISLPEGQFDRFDGYKGNGQSKLIQCLKDTIQTTYPHTDIHGDGQVVVASFSDRIRFELLPAFEQVSTQGYNTFLYPDSNLGGAWKATNPKAEQYALKTRNHSSNGLLFDTCKQIRTIRDERFTSYHLSGIVIDSFVYYAIEGWRWTTGGTASSNPGDYEKHLLEVFNKKFASGLFPIALFAPGSKQIVDTTKSVDCLKKVLTYMTK